MHLLGVTEVVATAGHHLLMTGPPGAGKTMQAREWDLQTRREGGTPRMGQMAAPIGKRRGHFGAISGVPALRFSARGWGRLLSRTGRAYCRIQSALKGAQWPSSGVVLCGSDAESGRHVALTLLRGTPDCRVVFDVPSVVHVVYSAHWDGRRSLACFQWLEAVLAPPESSI